MKKITVSREELDECIGSVIAEVIMESMQECNTNESFDDDDDDTSMWDDLLDKYLGTSDTKKAQKVAAKEIGGEMATINHDDNVSDEYDTFNDDDIEDDDENSEQPQVNPNAFNADEAFANAAAQETDPYFRKAINAGVDPRELYFIKNNKIGKKNLSEPDIDFVIKHRQVGKRPVSSYNTDF